MPINNAKIGENVRIPHEQLVNIYGCQIGNNVFIGPFVEIQKGVSIGSNVKIQSHTFICEGVTIEDNCFVGHNVIFINDKYPQSVNKDGSTQHDGDWTLIPTVIKKGVSLGSGSIILCGVTIGENAIIGAGAVVTKNVPPNSVYAGVPARQLREL